MITNARRARWSATIVVACSLSGWTAAQGLEDLVDGGCGTMSRWLAMSTQLMGPGCPFQGACDNPNTRDLHLPGPGVQHFAASLQINILCTSGGVCPFDTFQVESAITLLEQDLAAFNSPEISFKYRLRFINDSQFTTLTNLNFPNPQDFPMKDLYATDPAGHLNIWVTNILSTGFRGLATFPWDPIALTPHGGILLDVGEFNNPLSGTLAHEIGHALGLWHVFRGSSAETSPPCTGCWENNISWPPSPTQDLVGDFCKDTRPTDQNFTCAPSTNLEPCLVFQYGPFGQGVFRNFMQSSPFPENGCRNHFTIEQAGRMRCWLQDATPGWLTVEKDRCEDAVAISPGTFYGTTRRFAHDGESTCDEGAAPVDVWYRYNATVTRPVTVSMCGSGTNFDSQVSVTTDCGNQVATQVDCSSNYPQCGSFGQHGRFTFTATAGTSYFIRVANDSGGVGDYQLVLCEGTNNQCNRPDPRIKPAPGPPPAP